MVIRNKILNKVKKALKSSKIICLLGPRQCGKTTIANNIAREYPEAKYFNLENYDDLKKLGDFTVLSKLTGLIIIDEVQAKPEIFPYLKALYDKRINRKFLILSSASRDLIRQSLENLTFRINFIEVTPFSLSEVKDFERLWLRGGFPAIYLEDDKAKLGEGYSNYTRAYIENDLIISEFQSNVRDLRGFWYMLAHYHGQISDFSVIATSFSTKELIVRKYISYLESSFILRTLNQWNPSFKKKMVKSPKIYYRDSGLLNHTLGIKNYAQILSNVKAGSLFEGFAIEEVIKAHSAEENNCYFFTSDNGGELDLLIFVGDKKLGFEFKLSNSPQLTSSMQAAIKELDLDILTVICPNVKRKYMLNDKVQVISLKDYIDEVEND